MHSCHHALTISINISAEHILSKILKTVRQNRSHIASDLKQATMLIELSSIWFCNEIFIIICLSPFLPLDVSKTMIFSTRHSPTILFCAFNLQTSPAQSFSTVMPNEYAHIRSKVIALNPCWTKKLSKMSIFCITVETTPAKAAYASK